MTYELKIKSGNAAFEDDPAAEVARILREQAARIERGDDGKMILRDYNGNKVGMAYFNGDED